MPATKIKLSTNPASAALTASVEAAPLTEHIARQAAEWFFRLQVPDVSDADRQAFAYWCAADSRHAQAWQRAQGINAKFGSVPPQLAMTALNRAPDARRRLAIKTLAVLISAGPAGWLAWRSEPMRQVMADYRTATGERRSITLADGTHVQLNTGSAIDLAYDDKVRLLKLRSGEILVDTAPDKVSASHAAYRPFMVETAHGMLRALGTRFVVRQQDRHTRLAVLEGAVEIRPVNAPDSPQIIQAGQQTIFTSSLVANAEAADRHVDSWSRGVLYANAMRLDQFSTELARYRHGIVRCDPAVAELRISGAFQLDNTEPVLRSLEDALPVTVVYRTRYWVTIASR